MKAHPLTLFALFFVLIPLIIQPIAVLPSLGGTTPKFENNDTASITSGVPIASASKSPALPAGSPPLPSPEYSDVGAARPFHETANRTDGDQDVLLFYDSSTQTPQNDSGIVVLPPGWTGYRLDFSIGELYENRTWALNPSFNGNADNWSSGENDVIGYDNGFTQAWHSGGPDGNGYVHVEETGVLTGGFYRYDNNDRTWWRQTYSVNRSSIAWAAIRMDFRIDSAWDSNALFNVYVRINGTQVWAMGFQAVGDDNWHNTGFITISSSLFDIPNRAIELEVGIISTMTVGYSTNDWMRGEFDNIWLYMKTKTYPSEINLKMNGLVVQNEATRGSGKVSQIPTSVWTSSPVLAQLNWTPTTTPPDPDLDIRVTGICDLNLFANKTGSSLYAQSPTAVGVQFDVESGQNTSWTFYHLLALPTQYWNDSFNFTIPMDWNVTFVSEPQLPTVNKISQCQGGNIGDGYLIIPATDITNSPDGYWTIQAESHNYVDSAELQIFNGGWNPTTTVRASNLTRVEAYILDGSDNPPSGVASTQANVSIYNPDDTTIWYSELVTPTVTGLVRTTSFTIEGITTIGGTYTIVIFWDNSTEAGEYQTTYSVTHATTLVARESTIEAFYEDQPLYPKVRFNDTDKDVWLSPPATVEGNWTTGSTTFYWIVGTGYYEAEINALDVPDVGRYLIRVNATKSYYDDAYTFIMIDISAETRVYSPQAPSVLVAWKDNSTIQVRYTRVYDGAGVNNCIPYSEILANWTTNYYTIWEDGNGWYSIELNSTAKPLGTYSLNITLTKERYQRQTFFITVTVRARNTFFGYTPPSSVPHDENGTVSVSCSDLDAGAAAILNTTGALHFEIWNGSVRWPSGSDYFWITDLGGGLFNVYINTSYLPGVGNWNFNIKLNWYGQPYYANRTISLILTVRQFQTTVNYDSPEPTPWDEDATITIYFVVADAQSTQHNGDYIIGATITATLDGNPLVNMVNFTYSEVAPGEYEITIYKSVLSSITSYTLKVTLTYPNQPNPAHNFYASSSRQINFNVRRLHTFLTYTPPGTWPWDEDVNITIIYLVDDAASSHDGEAILPSVTITVTAIGGGWSIGPGDYTFIHLGSGQYRVIIDKSVLSIIQTYNARIDISETSTSHYQDATIEQLSFIVRKLYTGLSYVPPESTPVGDDVKITVTYIVTDSGSSHHGEGILPSVTITLTAIGGWSIGPGDYTYVHIGGGWYEITIDASIITLIQTYNLRIDISETSTGHYQAAAISQLSFTVRTVYTTYERDAIEAIGWGYNVTIVTYYSVLDAGSSQNGNPISGAPIIVTGVGWTLPSSHYTVSETMAGTYTILINTSAVASPGQWEINIAIDWPTSPPNYQERYLLADLIVTYRETSLTAYYIPSADYGAYINSTVTYYDIVGSRNIDNSTFGGHVRILVYNATDSLPIQQAIYNVTELGDSTYRVLINTSAFGRVNVFHTFFINATWDAGFQPFNGNASATIKVFVVGTKTTVLYTPPEPQPWSDDLVFVIRYNITDTGAAIGNDTLPYVMIKAQCISHIISLSYDVTMLNNGYNGYLLTIHTNNFIALGQYTFEVNVTWPTNVAPYYQSQKVLMSGYVRAIHTSLIWQLPGQLYWGDMLYFLVTYRDDDHGIVLSDPSNTSIITWLSWSNWDFVQIYGNGTYMIWVNTTGEDVGLRNFAMRFTSYPAFYEARQQLVQFTINPLPLYVTVLSPSPWTAKYKELVVITVLVTDEYGRLINDTTTVYRWAGLPEVTMDFMGAGVYNVSFAAEQDVGTYLVTVEARKTNCQTGLGSMTLYILPIDTALTVITSTITTVVGTSFTISVNFSTVSGVPLTAATVFYSWAGGAGTLIHVGNGMYNATLDSAGLDLGQYSVYVTASSPNVVEKLGLITVILTVIPAELQPLYSLINVNWSDSFLLLVYFTDTYNNLPIDGADIIIYWGETSGSLQAMAAPGWYNATLSTTPLSVGIFEVTLTVDHPGYQFTTTKVTVNILPQPTDIELGLVQAYYEAGEVLVNITGTSWEVPKGDVLRIYFNFTDSHGNPIHNATAIYYWEQGEGTLTYQDGLYIVNIDLTDVQTGLFSLNIYLQKSNYETGRMLNLPLRVILVPTEIISDPLPPIYTGDVITLTVWLNDTFHNLFVPGANLTITIPGVITGLEMTDNGDGSYTVTGLSVASEGPHTLDITAESFGDYAYAHLSIAFTVSLNPIVRSAISLGALAAVIGLIALASWLAYTKVFSIPWLVRKMRGMSKTIGKGKTPSLSGRDVRRIATRPHQMTGIIEPAYDAIGITIPLTVVPAAITFEEREAEDEIIWRELEKLEGLGHDQKLELFEEMKRIPPKDRVWFVEDLKQQMADGTRFGRPARPPEERLEVPEGIDLEVLARLNAIAALGPEEKQAVLEQLRGLSKEEQEEVISALEETEQ